MSDNEWIGTVSINTTDGLPLSLDGARNILSYSRESDERLLGIFGQDSDIHDWAQRNGYQIVGFARDNRIHGQLPAMERPALAAVIEAIQKKQVAGVVVERLDRVARDFTTQDDAMRRIWAAGGRIFTASKECDQEWKPDRPGDTQWTTRRAFAFRAEEEMYALIARLEAGRRKKMARGGYGGGNRFGGRRYGVVLATLQGKLEYIPVPAEQAVIRRIQTACDSGTSYSALARALNSERVPTVTGAKWSPKMVRTLSKRSLDVLILEEPEPITEPITWIKPARLAVAQ